MKVGLKDVECGLCEYVVNYVKQEVDDPIAQEQIKNSAIAVRASSHGLSQGQISSLPGPKKWLASATSEAALNLCCNQMRPHSILSGF